MEYIALGNFDGLHIGHRALIKNMVDAARKDKAIPSVCIFDPHPMKLIKPQNIPKMLTTISHKIEMLKSIGIENVHILKFDTKMADMDGFEFLDMLRSRYNIGMFALGYNYTFGKSGKWNSDDILAYCKQKSLKSIVLNKYTLDNIEVSSTKVREYIMDGNIKMARKLLGRPHIIEGIVVKGMKLGRKMNFPTANLSFNNDYCYPPNGVYFTATKHEKKWYYSITNVGRKPTVDNKIINIETHVLDYKKDLYGENISIAFLEKLRNQVKFNDIQELKCQLEEDEDKARKLIRSSSLDFNLQ